MLKINRQLPIWAYTLITLSAWTSIILILSYWNISIEKKGTIQGATIEARTVYQKDILYRRWNSDHGGVYVPITKKTMPNPYLTIPDRDIQTPGGTRLTKINPAYMTRQVHEMAEKMYGVKGHITSLKPIRPENAADDWETNALKAFDRGKKEISSIEIINNTSYLRFMRPLITEKQCLSCHAVQGYKLGDIRGGISVAVPLSPFKVIEKKHINTFYITYGLLWLMGTIGIIMVFFILNRQINHQIKMKNKLLNQEKIQGIIEMAGAVSHELNQPLQVVLTALELMNLNIKKNVSIDEELSLLIEHIEKMGNITDKLMRVTKYKTKKYLKGRIIDIDESSDSQANEKEGK